MNLLSPQQVKHVRQIELDPSLSDRLIFKFTGNGKFLIAKYIEEGAGLISHSEPWTRLVWNKFMPYRINAFMLCIP